MKERPILFSAPMVIAIREDRKTQTRRIVKEPTSYDGAHILPDCPYGAVGDRLWGRETFGRISSKEIVYRADVTSRPVGVHRWVPAIHMPRRLSRVTLEITDVRWQWLRDITEGDARAEGVKDCASYATLWDSINYTRGCGWAKNPVVWAITFKQVRI